MRSYGKFGLDTKSGDQYFRCGKMNASGDRKVGLLSVYKFFGDTPTYILLGRRTPSEVGLNLHGSMDELEESSPEKGASKYW